MSPMSQEERERVRRVKERDVVHRGPTGVAPTVPAWPTPTFWPTPPGQYARWGASGVGAGYAPTAAVADQPYLEVINRLLPYMARDDVEALSKQLYTAGGGAGGPFAGYLGLGAPGTALSPTATSSVTWPGRPWSGSSFWGTTPAAPAAPTTYENTLAGIEGVLAKIPDATAKAWAQAVFSVYRNYTPSTGMRRGESEAVLKAQMDELFASVPESAQPYAAAMQRLVQPTVRNVAREFYELRAPERTAPTNWAALGYTSNPQWL